MDVKMIKCPGCGAQFDEKMARCPYCDLMNYKGAESEYMEKLDDIKENLEDLTEEPKKEVVIEAKKQGKFVFKTFVIIGVIVAILAGVITFIMNFGNEERDTKADFLWKQEYFPQFDEMYEKKDYTGLAQLYEKVVEGNSDVPFYEWKHSNFVNFYIDCKNCKDIIDAIDGGVEVSEYNYKYLFNAEINMARLDLKSGLSDDDINRLDEYVKPLIKDLWERWGMSQEEFDEFNQSMEDRHGWADYDATDKYVENWLK